MEVAGTATCAASRCCRCAPGGRNPTDPQLGAAVTTLQDWLDRGPTAWTSDQNGNYDHAAAVQIMDAWWPRLLEAEFKPEMGTDFFNAVHAVLHFDNEPNNHGDAPRQRL